MIAISQLASRVCNTSHGSCRLSFESLAQTVPPTGKHTTKGTRDILPNFLSAQQVQLPHIPQVRPTKRGRLKMRPTLRTAPFVRPIHRGSGPMCVVFWALAPVDSWGVLSDRSRDTEAGVFCGDGRLFHEGAQTYPRLCQRRRIHTEIVFMGTLRSGIGTLGVVGSDRLQIIEACMHRWNNGYFRGPSWRGQRGMERRTKAPEQNSSSCAEGWPRIIRTVNRGLTHVWHSYR